MTTPVWSRAPSNLKWCPGNQQFRSQTPEDDVLRNSSSSHFSCWPFSESILRLMVSDTEANAEIMTGRAIPTSLSAGLLIILDCITLEEVTHLIHTTKQIGAISQSVNQQLRKLTQKKHCRKVNYKEGLFRSWITTSLSHRARMNWAYLHVMSSSRLYIPRGLKHVQHVSLLKYPSHQRVRSRVYNSFE